MKTFSRPFFVPTLFPLWKKKRKIDRERPLMVSFFSVTVTCTLKMVGRKRQISK